MKLKIIFAIISLAFSVALAAQRKSIEDLKDRLPAAQEIDRVNILIELSELTKFSDADQAYAYSQEALKIAKEKSYQSGVAKSSYQLGILARDRRNLRRALRFAGQGLEAFEGLGDSPGMLESYQLLKTIYRLLNRNEEEQEMETKFRLLERSIATQEEIARLEDELVSRKTTIDQQLEEKSSILDTIAVVKEAKDAALTALELAEEDRAVREAEILRLEKVAAETEKEAALLEKDAALQSLSLQKERNLRNMAYAVIAGLLLILFLVWQRSRILKQRERSRLERERIKRLEEIDRLKDQFLANTSHELRTPLNGIIGMAESMYEQGEQIPRALLKDNLSVIIAAGKRLNNLVSDIMDFARLKNSDLNLKLRPVDMYSLVDVVVQVSHPMLKGKDLVVNNHIAEAVPLVQGDENRIYQILYNLLGNAIKFTDQGQIDIRAREDNGFLEVSVTDTGIGIEKEKQELIFQSFQQADASEVRSYQGTGLGLSITKHLVELHHGKIWVESDPAETNEDKGATFFFTLPLAAEGAEAPVSTSDQRLSVVQPAAVPVNPGAKLPPVSKVDQDEKIQVLIVDDEPINLHVLSSHLTQEHYDIQLATNGEEALAMIDTGQKFDLVLLDIMMPKMSGYEVCRIIREQFLPSELPVIMVTAKDQVKDLVQGLNLGANDYLAKPFAREEILARIKTQINLLHINKVTGRFVPNAFLQSLGRDNITEVMLGDQVERQVTVFFSDIRGYTLLSEQMTPDENFRFVSAYFQRIGPFITKNSGFINQYLGDGIMAIFSDHPSDALRASIEIQQAITHYNELRKKKGRLPISAGIGFHSGKLIMGIIGDDKRLDATTISDTVNTASRIESLNKYYGTNILLSEASLQELKEPETFGIRYLGKVQVKGKEVPVGIYECFDGDPPDSKQLKSQTAVIFNNAIAKYFDRKFEEAVADFTSILAQHKDDRTVQLFLEKAEYYLENGVPEDWSGVEKMDAK